MEEISQNQEPRLAATLKANKLEFSISSDVKNRRFDLRFVFGFGGTEWGNGDAEGRNHDPRRDRPNPHYR